MESLEWKYQKYLITAFSQNYYVSEKVTRGDATERQSYNPMFRVARSYYRCF